MNNDNVGRVAFVGILGVIGAVAIKKPELSGQAGVNEQIKVGKQSCIHFKLKGSVTNGNHSRTGFVFNY